MHFILSDSGDYDFDVKVGRCGFVGFVNEVIDCGCLGCVFCFKIKEKEKEKGAFYINFYSLIFLRSCFLFFIVLNFSLIQLNNYIIDMCVQFIIVSLCDELITNKVLKIML